MPALELNIRNYLERVRALFYQNGVRRVTMDDIQRELGLSSGEIRRYFQTKGNLVKQLLDQERHNFEVIFEKHNFDGVNSIDVLLTVSKEISDNFMNISPSMTFDFNKYYPEIYAKHMDERVEFIYGQIQLNIKKGIRDGVYRSDLTIELISRLYIRRLIDIHNPEYFPSRFSFETLFDAMFDNFVRGIGTEEGIRYYEKQKKMVTFSKRVNS